MIITFTRRAALACSLTAAFILSATACGEDAAPAQATAAKLDDTTAMLVVANYAANVFTSYSDVVTKTAALKTAVDAFVGTPTEANLTGAKQAWLDARVVYGQTEGYRFYDGPIDNAVDGPEGRINAWPLDENFIDYVEKDGGGIDASAGIINDLERYPSIDKSVIAAANEKDGEANLSAGWHAIEFLLWGQDHSAIGPGARPIADYEDKDGNPVPNPIRRGAYLKAATELLLDDVTTVRDAWAPGIAGNYRAKFETQAPGVSVASMLKGIGTLASAELPQERMLVALKAKTQEDEHSCFSDNTHVDIQANALSVQNVWLGKYGSNDGPGLDELVRKTNPDLADKTTTSLAEAIEHCNDIKAPFDQIIVSSNDAPERKNAEHAAEALIEAGGRIVESSAALGLSITTTLE